MIRRNSSTKFQYAPTDKIQAFAATGSLLLGVALVFLASAFMQNTPPDAQANKATDRIFQVGKWLDKPDGERLPSTKTAGLLAPVLAAQVPGIAEVARVMSWPEEVTLGDFDHQVTTKQWVFTDPAFFRVFDIEFIAGDANTALSRPGQLVLTEKIAKKIFGTTDVVGKSLIGLGGKPYQVSGVIRNPTRESAVPCDLLASWSSTEGGSGIHDFRFMNNWIGQTVETYVLLRDAGAVSAVESQLSNVLRQEISGQPGQYPFFLQALPGSGAKSGAVGMTAKSRLSSNLVVPGTGMVFQSLF